MIIDTHHVNHRKCITCGKIVCLDAQEHGVDYVMVEGHPHVVHTTCLAHIRGEE